MVKTAARPGEETKCGAEAVAPWEKQAFVLRPLNSFSSALVPFNDRILTAQNQSRTIFSSPLPPINNALGLYTKNLKLQERAHTPASRA
jgi:hypothetical protein